MRLVSHNRKMRRESSSSRTFRRIGISLSIILLLITAVELFLVLSRAAFLH